MTQSDSKPDTSRSASSASQWVRRLLIVLTVFALGLLAAQLYTHWPQSKAFYTDAETIREPHATAKIRRVLWQPPKRLSDPVNSLDNDYEPRLTANGQTLFFVNGKAGGSADIFVSRKSATGWSTPNPIDSLNTEFDELGPAPTKSGDSLYFYSDRPTGHGGYDIWVAHLDGDTFGEPINLGPSVNSEFNDYGPALTPDDGRLYFASNRPRASDDKQPDPHAWPSTIREDLFHRTYDLYTSQLSDAGPVPAIALDLLNTPFNEGTPAVSPADDFVYFSSDRPSGYGGFDLYRARILDQKYQQPENLGAAVNTTFNELDAALHMGGYGLIFSSDRPQKDQVANKALTYDLFETASREVFVEAETHYASIDWASIWNAIGPNLLWAILALLMLLAMLSLMQGFKNRKLSLIARCVLASLAAHILLMFLLNVWEVTSSLAHEFSRGGKVRVVLASPAQESGTTSQIHGDFTQKISPKVVEFSSKRASSSIKLTAVMPMQQTSLPEPASPQLTPFQQVHSIADANVQRPTNVNMLMTEQDLSRTKPVQFATPTDIQVQKSPEVDDSRAPKAERLDAPAARPPTQAPMSSEAKVAMMPVSKMDGTLIPQEQLTDATTVAQDARLASTRKPTNLAGEYAPALPTMTRLELADQPMEAARIANNESRMQIDTPTEPTEAPRSRMASAFIETSTSAMTYESKPKPTDATADTLEVSRTVVPVDAPTRELAHGVPANSAVLPEIPNSLLALGTPQDLAPRSIKENKIDFAEVEASTSNHRVALPKLPNSIAHQVQLETDSIPVKVTKLTPTAPIGDVVDSLPHTNLAKTSAFDLSAARLATPLANSTQPALSLPKETIEHANPYAHRRDSRRSEILANRKGSNATDKAVRLALQWLAAHQSSDGRWDGQSFDKKCGECGGETNVETDISITGLAILCFLSADHSHVADGPYRGAVKRALDWLLKQQEPDGDLRPGETMYTHAIATIALAEAYAITGDPILREPIRRAIDFSEAKRNEADGLWGVNPGTPADTSVLGWQMLAMTSAKTAGFDIPGGIHRAAKHWMSQVATPGKLGAFAYRPGTAYSPAMTAEGLLIQQLLGRHPDDPDMRASAAFLLQNLPDWNAEPNTYYWYFATQALFQQQGQAWEQWNNVLVKELLTNQRHDGRSAGSWDPTGEWAKSGGRVYQTALCTLMLQAYYRYQPLFEEDDRIDIPVDAIGSIRGTVTNSATGKPIPDATVRLTLPDQPAIEATTNQIGGYRLFAPEMPPHFALSASGDGYTPSSVNVPSFNLKGGVLDVDFKLEPALAGVIAIEAVPEVHHLGDNKFDGRINSQFQKRAEGDVYEVMFAVSANQLTGHHPDAILTLLAKGVQFRHELYINGVLLPEALDRSPRNGSFGVFEVTFDANLLQAGENSFTINAGGTPNDIDDFEFVNVQIHLSL